MEIKRYDPIPQSAEESASLVKRIIIGSLIAEYAMRELRTHGEVKYRANIAIRACEKVQSYLLNNPVATEEHRLEFRRQFLKDNAVLIGDLVELVWDLDSDDLVHLIEQIKKNTDGIQLQEDDK
jgi:hypothetical protein